MNTKKSLLNFCSLFISGFLSLGLSSCASSNKSSLTFKFGNAVVFNKAAVGSTQSITASLSPSNASCNLLNWATSDASKVSIASTTTVSGGSQTLTLISLFDDTVTITVSSFANPSVTGSYSVTCVSGDYSFSVLFVGWSYDSSDIIPKGTKYEAQGDVYDGVTVDSSGAVGFEIVADQAESCDFGPVFKIQERSGKSWDFENFGFPNGYCWVDFCRCSGISNPGGGDAASSSCQYWMAEYIDEYVGDSYSTDGNPINILLGGVTFSLKTIKV